MVRFKSRYYLLEVDAGAPLANFQRSLLAALRHAVQRVHGDFGAGSVQQALSGGYRAAI